MTEILNRQEGKETFFNFFENGVIENNQKEILATYQWDRYQLEEVYNFTPDGNTFVNAGIVYDHDTNGNIKREVLTYRDEHFAINKVKMKTRNRYNISEHVEHAYEIQDIIIG